MTAGRRRAIQIGLEGGVNISHIQLVSLSYIRAPSPLPHRKACILSDANSCSEIKKPKRVLWCAVRVRHRAQVWNESKVPFVS